MPCNQCSYCCLNINLHFPRYSKDWVDARQFRILQMTKDWIQVRMPHKCPKLKDGKCSIHVKKPSDCKDFPHTLVSQKSIGLDPLKSMYKKCGFFNEIRGLCNAL
jgi:hypothetical protein